MRDFLVFAIAGLVSLVLALQSTFASDLRSSSDDLPFIEGQLSGGVLMGFVHNPVFTGMGSVDLVVAEQGAVDFGLKAGLFIPVSQFALDLSGYLSHARMSDFSHSYRDYSGQLDQIMYVNPHLSYGLVDVGLHIFPSRKVPLSFFGLVTLGVKIASTPLSPISSVTPAPYYSDFTAGFGMGARIYMAKSYSVQLEYRRMGTFLVTTTTSSSGSTTEDLSEYTGIFTVGFFYHLNLLKR